MISGVRRNVDEICAVLGYYAALSGNPLLTFGTAYQSQNFSKGLPFNAA
jgi:hypothetical protein